MKKVFSILKNKYLLTGAFFLVWLTFFDRFDFISQSHLRGELNKVRQDKKYYQEQIKLNAEQMRSLQTDKANLERFAREKYLMKKDNEDVFVVVNSSEIKSAE